MEGPFNSAWALLKNEPYPLTLVEEINLQLQHKAYELARGANPQPHWMTDERYDELIEESAERILAGMMTKKNPDYPWPKNQPFQTTFENDGSINRDPKVSEQRKLNARMGRESNRREAVPSRIEISPRDNNRGKKDFSLVNDEGEVLSQISGHGGDKYNPQIHDFYGSTPEPYRRQNMYRNLMQALIGAGIPIVSNERNYQSDPFHRKFMQNLPANIKGDHLTEDDGSHHQALGYQRQDVPQFLDARGQRSGLNRQDYGAIPIVNQKNQARNMDELAEQDRLKIRRGQGHIAETAKYDTTQPMARNTKQQRFDPNFENESPPLYDGYYNNQGFYERQGNNPQ
jgi:hypothetical protein